MKRLKVSKRIVIDILIILIVGLVSFTWFKSDLVFSYGDVIFRFSPITTFKNSFYVWSQWYGVFDVQGLAWLPHVAILALWELLKFPLHVIHKLTYYYLFAAAGLSMYYLVLNIIKSEKRYTMGLIAAFFYMFNCFALVMLWNLSVQSIYLYPFLPLALALFIRGLEKGKLLKHVLLINGVGILAATSFSNASFVVLFWLNIFLYLVYYFFSNLKNRKRLFFALKLFLVSLVVWLGINSYWMVPYAKSLTTGFLTDVTEDLGVQEGTVEIVKALSNTAHLANAFRMYGYWAFDDNAAYGVNDPLYSFAEPYVVNPFFIVLSYLIPFFVFLSLFVVRKKVFRDKFFIVYFLLFSLFILFLYKGSQPPLGEFYLWLSGKTSLMAAFRHPMGKFGLLLPLGYAVLFAYSLAEIYFYFKKKYTKRILVISTSLLAVCFIFFVYFQFPFWTGKIFKEHGALSRGSLVRVPEYYREAGEWLKQDEQEFRIVPVPMTSAWGIPLNWQYGYMGIDPTFYLLDRPLIRALDHFTYEGELWTKMTSSSPEDLEFIKDALGFLNVKYVMVHKDIVREYFNVDETFFDKAVVNLENGIPGLKKDKVFGDLEFYKLDEEFFTPKIYIADVTDENIDKNIPVFPRVNPDILEFQRVNPDILEFQRVNPTKYYIKIRGAKANFNIFFAERYNPDWKAYIVDKRDDDLGKLKGIMETWKMTPVNEENHVKEATYDQGWFIERPNGQEDFDIILEFEPQKQAYWGIAVTFATLVILLIVGVVLVIISKRNNGNKHHS